MGLPLRTSISTNLIAEEEQRLVSGVLAKDRKATARFVQYCSDYVYPFVRRRLMPQCELSEDLTQEVLLAAWRTLSQFRGDSSLKSWVLGIARHKIEDYYRNRIREMELPEDGEETSDELITPARLDEQLEAAEQTEKVQRTLSKIPEAYCLALLWRYREGKSLRDMAEATGKTEKAMERMLARARETFRRRWNDGQS